MLDLTMVLIRRVMFILVAFFATTAFPSWALDDLLLQQLTQAPKAAAVSLSSDGHYLAALLRGDKNEPEIAVWRVGDDEHNAERLPYTRSDLNWLSWVGGGRLLLSLKENGLVLYDAHVGRLRPLIDGVGPKPDELLPVLLSALPDDPANILMQWEDPGVPGYPAVYRVNALTGISEKIMGAWRPIIRWWASPSGVVEMGEGYRGRKQQLYGRRADGAWAKIAENDYFKDTPMSVVAVEAGGATAAVIAAHDSNTRSLWRVDTRTGEYMERLAHHGRFDIDAAIIDPVSNFLVGATYVSNAQEEFIWRADYKMQLASAQREAGVSDIELVSESTDRRVKLYRSRANWRPHRYFIKDTETDTLVEVASDKSFDDLPRARSQGVYIPLKGKRIKDLGPMHAILSIPSGGATGKAVVLVHGGPVRRASDRYSPIVRWLNANGYSVLQPNFRGSSGFGEKWRRAGYAQWGNDMQDDVRTAAEWMLESGYASYGNMCVMGGSYGGYASLMSAIKDDDLFECAVSLNGVTSVYHLAEYFDTHRFSLLTVPRIKGRLSNRSLRRRSPLYRADLIKLPVLLLHATKDANVPFDQGVGMAKALQQEGKEHTFIVIKDAEHQLKRTDHRRIYYRAAVEFLNQHTAGHETAQSR
ncbi:alpha/beta hydrolase family protein [Kordiimonas aquimaris]|uniref:alpha/beta hydrolase family protein n=1 Tax=Kordiimonas aquimaris TaxID=707591 RepID=UPI0021D3117E|nr:prolyl oligopeptidase family serine peptidase [Kordiimonas aquimaris]